ncbi:methylated-DNA--[protein]-cysteine S-methyltransferase [Chloroflexota bacterium]
MNQQLNYTIFTTNMGLVGIIGSAKGLRRTTLPQHSTQEVHQLLGEGINQAEWSPATYEDLIARLRLYLKGCRVIFPDTLDLPQANLFQREVWTATRLIPYGETRSYTWVAEQAGKPKAQQAIGQALGRNPLPIIIPCHRVVTSNSKLGGYTGGIETKKQLLYLEGGASLR